MGKHHAHRRQASTLASRQQAGQREHQMVEEERVAIGLNCVRCGLPLQIAESSAPTIIESLRATGLVYLLCVCGQLQLVGLAQSSHDEAVRRQAYRRKKDIS